MTNNTFFKHFEQTNRFDSIDKRLREARQSQFKEILEQHERDRKEREARQ